MESYLDVRACPCLCPLGDARLTPLAFLGMHASGKVSRKAWTFLLFLVLPQGVEHLGDRESQVLEMSVVLASRLFFRRPVSPPLLPYVVWVGLCLLPDSGGRHATEAWHMGTPHCLSCGDWVQVGHTSHAWPMRGNSGTFTRACKGHILWSPANR